MAKAKKVVDDTMEENVDFDVKETEDKLIVSYLAQRDIFSDGGI